MLIESSKIEPNATVEADICIIGGGPAGVTLAEHLNKSNQKILILEAGGLEYDEKVSNPYHGETTGETRMTGDSYLGYSRQRFLGGTSNHWSGWCCRMEPLDFEKREWIPNSGWPISYADIEPFYKKAEKYLKLRAPSAFSDIPAPLTESTTALQTKFYEIKAKKFKTAAVEAFSDSQEVDIVVNAPVSKFMLASDGKTVESVRILRHDKKEFSVTAKKFVLACGGVENARILLASNYLQENTFANQNDVVGRFFQEHPHLYVGYILTSLGSKDLRTYDFTIDKEFKSRVVGVLGVSPEAQIQHQLYNSVVQLKAKQINEKDDLLLALEDATSQFEENSQATDEHFYSLYLRSEMAPLASNRVSLDTDNLDSFNIPRATLHVSVSNDELLAYTRLGDLIAKQMGATHGGRLKLLLNKFKPKSSLAGGYHHMGTTRMHDNPKHGVVDSDCKVHDCENLYIAGSSVFPTSGYANPTLTIVALAMRLGEHLDMKSA